MIGNHDMTQKPVRPRESFLVFGSPAIEESEIAEVVASMKSGWLGNFRRVEGLNRVWKYLVLFGLAIFLGFLSSIHPGPKIVGASTLICWCGLTLSTGIAALAALRGTMERALP